MTRPRKSNDGLPHRLYERFGLKTYSIGYKTKEGSWSFRLSCPVEDKLACKRLRRDAIRRTFLMSTDGSQIETVAQLVTDWFEWQKKLPEKSTRKRAASTMDENLREAKNIVGVFGEMAIIHIKPHHAYKYLELCDEKGRGPKGNKEIQLFQLILQRAVRLGIIDSNPLREVEKLPTCPSTRYVEHSELALALEVGKRMGGQMYRASLALATGYLCVRRSTEVLSADWAMVRPEGLMWTAGKRRGNAEKRTVLIKWSEQLRQIIDSLKAMDGYSEIPQQGLLFRTEDGNRYTRGGWKATLRRLMRACETEAQKRGIPFTKFNLQDQRPKAVTDKLTSGHSDVQDATLHSSDRMIKKVYDRRKKIIASPVG